MEGCNSGACTPLKTVYIIFVVVVDPLLQVQQDVRSLIYRNFYTFILHVCSNPVIVMLQTLSPS
jgi:hypothetical protein